MKIFATQKMKVWLEGPCEFDVRLCQQQAAIRTFDPKNGGPEK